MYAPIQDWFSIFVWVVPGEFLLNVRYINGDGNRITWSTAFGYNKKSVI
jgi:hypothetical protein